MAPLQLLLRMLTYWNIFWKTLRKRRKTKLLRTTKSKLNNAAIGSCFMYKHMVLWGIDFNHDGKTFYYARAIAIDGQWSKTFSGKAANTILNRNLIPALKPDS